MAEKINNVAIIGSGPAGYTAALYASRANLKPILFLGSEEGGQLMLTTEVENYPGFPEGILGPELMEKFKTQAERFGTTYIEEKVIEFEIANGHYILKTKKAEYQSKTVIIAVGASTRWLGLSSEQKYRGRGVSSCATCDAFFFKDKKVFVVGGGDSACEEANFITRFASSVTMIHRRDQLRASKVMQDRVKSNKKISFIWNTVVEEVLGDGTKMTGLKLRNILDKKKSEVKGDGVFVAIGHVPNTEIFKGKVDLDEKGYVKAAHQMHTNLPGVFVCGDVQDIRYKQAVTAAGTGCQAALEAEWYLEGGKVEARE